MTPVLAVLLLCAGAGFLVFWTKRLGRLSKWDHFPGYTSYSNIPLLGHVYK